MLFKKSKKEYSDNNFDYMIVGLGNPGSEYENTRHNIGFVCLDELCSELGAECKKLKFKSLTGSALINGRKCLLLKPQTFMNLSGQAVSEAMRFYKIPPERIIVIYDDISLNVGGLRIRTKGSDGGHNGIKNIIYLTGSDRFLRIKIGVGQKPDSGYDLKDWVLGHFSKSDSEILRDTVRSAVQAAICLVNEDAPTAMNRFNRTAYDQDLQKGIK